MGGIHLKVGDRVRPRADGTRQSFRNNVSVAHWDTALTPVGTVVEIQRPARFGHTGHEPNWYIVEPDPPGYGRFTFIGTAELRRED